MGLLGDAFDGLKEAAAGVVDDVKQQVQEVKQAVIETAKEVVQEVKQVEAKVEEKVAEVKQEVKQQVKQQVAAVKEKVQEVGAAVEGAVATAEEGVKEKAAAIVEGAENLAEGAVNAAGAVKDEAVALAGGAVETVAEEAQAVKDGAIDLSNQAIDAASQGIAAVGEEIDGAKAAVVKFVHSITGPITRINPFAEGGPLAGGPSPFEGGGLAVAANVLGLGGYEPGEREASASSPGRIESTGSRIILFDFAVNRSTLKPEHRKFLSDLVRQLDLDDAASTASIGVCTGFTDDVDTEPKNATLRHDRADTVQIFLLGKGALEESVGVVRSAAPGEFLASNKTRAGRARNRAVTITTVASPNEKVKVTPVKEPDPPEVGSRLWALQSNVSVSIPGKPGVAAQTLNFILHDRKTGRKHLMQFTGIGAGFGVSFPVSVALPAPTDFETTAAVEADAFTGGGEIHQANIGVGIIGFSSGSATLHLATKPPQIDISGFQFSLGVDVSIVGGTWRVLD